MKTKKTDKQSKKPVVKKANAKTTKIAKGVAPEKINLGAAFYGR
jgi:GH18 family chitinase